MDVVINPSFLKGSLDVISSKSLSHRFVIAAALANGVSEINNILISDDIIATKEALKQMNIKIEDNKVYGGTLKPSNLPIDCNESGSTLRFLIPFAWLFNETQTFIGKGKLPTRSLNVYEEISNKFNYTFNYNLKFLPLSTKGPMKSGIYEIDGNVSSQFVSGLLFTLPLLQGDSKIVFKTPLESKDYAILTIDVLNQFGIDLSWDEKEISIKGNQKYLPIVSKIEGDYSQAAFFIVGALINGDIKLNDLNKNSLQGDKEILEIIKRMGANINFDETLSIVKEETHGTTIDLKDIPDLGPILMVLASISKGQTIFKNIERLRIKESDRVEATYQLLSRMNADIQIVNEEVIINGKNSLEGHCTVDSFNDHRIAMAAAIAGLRANGPVIIKNAHVVSKSYPTFFDDYKKLGGIVDEIK